MFWRNKTIISEKQRGLLFYDQQFVRVLMPGVYRFNNWQRRYTFKIVNLHETESQAVSDEVLYLNELHPDLFAEFLQHWETTENQVDEMVSSP